MRNKKANAIVKRPANKIFRSEHTNGDANQGDKTRQQNLRWETAEIGDLKGKYEC